MLSTIVHLKAVTPGAASEEIRYTNDAEDLGRTIHPDDTIYQAKLKLATKLQCPPAAMLLFYFREEKLSIENLYGDLSQDGTIPITRSRLLAALANIHPLPLDDLANQDTYSYTDLLALPLPVSPRITRFMGIAYNVNESYPVCVNPFDLVDVDEELIERSQTMVSTADAQLILHHGPVDTLYVVTAKDAATYFKDFFLPNPPPPGLLSVYFPHLVSENIDNPSSLEVAWASLLQKTLLEVTSLTPMWNVVDMVYAVGKQTDPLIERLESGIKAIDIVQHPTVEVNIPIGVIFKLVSTTPERTLVKYNAGPRMEKLFRLYAPNIAMNGKKVPSLSKSRVAKISNELAREKAVGVFLQEDDGQYLVTFFPNGNIKTSAKFISPMSITAVSDSLTRVTEGIIVDINSFTEQSGYVYEAFRKFDTSVEILNIDYVERFRPSSFPEIGKQAKCMASIFSIDPATSEGGLLMTGIRVGFFNRMSAIDAFITRNVKRGIPIASLPKLVEESFDITSEEATDQVTKWMGSVQVEQNAYRNKRLSVNTSSGITVIAVRDAFDGSITFTATDIFELGAVPLLSQQLNALIGISTKKALAVERPMIKKVCKAVSKVPVLEKPEFGVSTTDIVAPNNLVNLAEAFTFDDEPGDEEGDGDLLDELFGEMDDDELVEIEAEPVPSPTIDTVKGTPALGTPSDVMQDDSDTPLENLDGRSLTNPNYFFDRMYKRDPELFLKQENGRFNAYSRLCPHNLRRQPVVVSDAEKERIERENPGAIDFDKAIRYGSTPDKAQWYICPRYWCLKTGMPLTPEQVEAGECGGKIIPFKAKTVPPGHYIYEFNAGTRNNEHIDGEGNYIQHYPGFLEKSRHPKEKCIPCCFKGPWEKAALERRRKACSETGDAEPQHKRSAAKEPAKFPLRDQERGFLPPSLEAVLRTRNVACQISSKNRTLRSDHPCLLRAGVEQTREQSFLAAIGAAHDPPLNVTDVKQKLSDIIDLDTFMAAQNGSLIGAFVPDGPNSGITVEDVLQKAESSRLRFIDYLNQVAVQIDYTYLWDIVSRRFFAEPVNLIILEIPDDDVTDNVRLVCPTNHYRSTYYEEANDSLVLMKKSKGDWDYYEPIFVYIEQSQARAGAASKEVIKFFSPGNRRIPLNGRTAVHQLGSLLSQCSAEQTYNESYIFKKGAGAEETIEELTKAGNTIDKHVLNYDGKTVGLLVRHKGATVYVPTRPSGSIEGLQPTTIGDNSIWNDYRTTVDALEDIATKTRLPVRPKVKVKQGKLVWGILTESDLFVQLSVPAEDISPDGLIVRSADNPNDVDDIAFTASGVDEERVRIMTKLELEREYYSAFRNTFRHLMAAPRNLLERENILQIIASFRPYLHRHQQIIEILRKVGGSSVTFAEYDDEALAAIERVATCITSKDCTKEQSCLGTVGACVLAIPKNHLITGDENEEVYYGRVADELLRYPRVRSYLLDRNTYLRLAKDDYDLHSNEVIVLSSVLFADYYNDLVPRPASVFMAAPTYDDVVASQSRAVVVEAVELRQGETESVCSSTKKPLGSKEVWFSLLPDNTYIQRFTAIPQCGFDLVAIIASDITASIVTSQDIRHILSGEYTKLLPTEEQNIIQTLKAQGKRELMTRLTTGTVTLPDLVMTEQYWLTNLDLRILSRATTIPLVLISGSKVLDNKERSLMTAPASRSQKLIIVKQHGMKVDTPQQYSLLYSGTNMGFSVDELSASTLRQMKATVGAPLFAAKKRVLEVAKKRVLEVAK